MGNATDRNAAREQQEKQEKQKKTKFKYNRIEHDREVGCVLERRIRRGFQQVGVPDEEESELIKDGGRARALAKKKSRQLFGVGRKYAYARSA